MNKKIILIGFMGLLMSLSSCAQNTKNKKNMNTNYIEKVKNIYKEVKKYEYNPTYQLKVNSNLCTYEIYINEMLVDYSFTTGRSAGEQNIDIPQYILKSGIQSIELKVYPKAIKNGILEKSVDKNADFAIRIVHGEYNKMKFEDFKEVLSMKLPNIAADLPFIELQGEFTAKVPYVLEGWSNGMNLKKEDPEKLKEEVLGRMKEIANLYRNKDIEGLANEQYNRTKEIDQSMYLNRKENSEEWITELQESLDEATATDLLDGKMKIMGNDKIVTILISSGPFRNRSIIRSETKDSYDFYPQSFYRPSPGARLEVIR